MKRLLGVCIATLALGSTAPALAADVPCAPAEKGTITLDGLADDWNEVKGAATGDDAHQLSLRCNVEGATLYLAIQADDERIVRTKQARPGEDHIGLSLGSKRFAIFPASETQKAKLSPGGAKLASTANGKGFIIELALPLASLGQGKRPERVPFSLRFDDCDSAVTLKAERSVSIDGELAFVAGASTLDSFLADRGLSRGTVRFQQRVRVGKDAVQIVLAGKYLAQITSEGFGYVELPAADGQDIQKPELVDLAGDGRVAVVLRYTERGEGGSREVLAAFRPVGAELRRVFAVELGKRVGSGRLATKLVLKRRGRATNLVVEAVPAEGLTAERYEEAPATDMEPILLPWSSAKKATFSFSGDKYQRR